MNVVIAIILRFSTNSIALLAKYVTVVECRPVMSVNIVSQFQSSTFGHNYPTLQLCLSAIAELLFCMYYSIIHAKKLSNGLMIYRNYSCGGSEFDRHSVPFAVD